MNQPSQLPAQRRLYRAFLSHSHVDREFVKQLHYWLNQEAEIPVWYDAFNLSASAAIPTELANAISACRSMIIIVSNSSIRSGWVEEEYNFAVNQRAKYKQFRIIPIRIEECESPGFLQSTRCIDAFDKHLNTAEQWQQPSTPHYIFFSTDIEHEQINQVIKNATQHITAMPCKLGDKIKESQIRESIVAQIINAQLVIADITQNNINSCIEAGIAIGAERPLKLIAHAPRGKIPFMLNNNQTFTYNNDIELLAIIHKITYPFRRRVLNSELPRSIHA